MTEERDCRHCTHFQGEGLSCNGLDNMHPHRAFNLTGHNCCCFKARTCGNCGKKEICFDDMETLGGYNECCIGLSGFMQSESNHPNNWEPIEVVIAVDAAPEEEPEPEPEEHRCPDMYTRYSEYYMNYSKREGWCIREEPDGELKISNVKSCPWCPFTPLLMENMDHLAQSLMNSQQDLINLQIQEEFGK